MMTCCKNCDNDAARHLVERILEDESLTADLVDDAAEVLLDWGRAQAETMARQAEALSGEYLDERLADLRRTMKRISKQAGEAAPEIQTDQVKALLATQIETTRTWEDASVDVSMNIHTNDSAEALNDGPEEETHAA